MALDKNQIAKRIKRIETQLLCESWDRNTNTGSKLFQKVLMLSFKVKMAFLEWTIPI
jgi:hypothetical protein